MLTPVANRWNTRRNFPQPGALVYVIGGTEDRYSSRPLWWKGRKRLAQVESYAVADSPVYHRRHFSYGIHCATVRFLDNGEARKFAYQYLVDANTGTSPDGIEYNLSR